MGTGGGWVSDGRLTGGGGRGGEGTHLLGEDRGNTRGARAGRCNVRDVMSFARTLDALRECTFFTRFSRCDIVPLPHRPGPRSNLEANLSNLQTNVSGSSRAGTMKCQGSFSTLCSTFIALACTRRFSSHLGNKIIYRI